MFFRRGASIGHSGGKVRFNAVIPQDFDKNGSDFHFAAFLVTFKEICIG
ncbi:MAG: hypothetical protein K6G91_00945 [Kiritimatiellae bacterium]|nr:hypothetical protein [Kiritimatiellia bacterium]